MALDLDGPQVVSCCKENLENQKTVYQQEFVTREEQNGLREILQQVTHSKHCRALQRTFNAIRSLPQDGLCLRTALDPEMSGLWRYHQRRIYTPSHSRQLGPTLNRVAMTRSDDSALATYLSTKSRPEPPSLRFGSTCAFGRHPPEIRG
jgi:hypothetical protein